MRQIALKALPYAISILAGIVIYILTTLHIKEESLNALILGIASGLLSIPMVFLFYDVVNKKCSKNLKNSLFQHASFEINAILFQSLKNIKIILQYDQALDENNIDELLAMSKEDIAANLKLDLTVASDLDKARLELTNIVYKNSDLGSLSDAEFEKILAISKELNLISKELAHQIDIKEKEQGVLVNNISILLRLISEWFDLCEEEAVLNHQCFRLIK